MKRLTRRSFIRVGAAAAAGLWLESCGLRPLLDPGAPPAPGESPLLKRHGPIDRTLGEALSAGFAGDDPGLHAVVRDGERLFDDPVGTPERVRVAVIGGGMSGLASAYSLRDLNPVLLEASGRFGGMSQGQSWRGIDYSIGAAYFAYPTPGSQQDRFYRELGLQHEWRVDRDGSMAVRPGGTLERFWDDPEHKAVADYFKGVAAAPIYPDIPAVSTPGRTLIDGLDGASLDAHLRAALGDSYNADARAMIELYCWTAFGGSSSEIGAAYGLNFLAGEFSGICVLPGGNARVAERLLSELSANGKATRLRPNSPVFRVLPKSDAVEVHYQDAGGNYRLLLADAVVMACPKFAAKLLCPDLGRERAADFDALEYRAYLVANALVDDEPASRDWYEAFLLGEPGLEPGRAEAESAKRKATDFVFGTYARPVSGRTVLTVYRALPFAGRRARPALLEDGAFDRVSAEFRTQVEAEILPALGMKPSAVKGWRFSRFGHALPLARTGLIASGVCDRLRAPFRDRIFFINQDNWALPAIETCLAETFAFAPQVREAVS